jgi:hypothetical protein
VTPPPTRFPGNARSADRPSIGYRTLPAQAQVGEEKKAPQGRMKIARQELPGLVEQDAESR